MEGLALVLRSDLDSRLEWASELGSESPLEWGMA